MKIEKELIVKTRSACNFCNKGEYSEGPEYGFVYPYEHTYSFTKLTAPGLKASICDDCLNELFYTVQLIKNGPYDEANIFRVLSKIPLDIEGSNLENIGWMPELELKSEDHMGEAHWNAAVKEYGEQAAKVLFKNVYLQWDSCDCGGGYPCSHGSYVYQINIGIQSPREIHFEDSDQLNFSDGKGIGGILPINDKTTVWDFYKMCQMCGIELKFTEAAKKLLQTP